MYATTVAVGIALLYFYDVPGGDVETRDRKVAMMIPALWMLALAVQTQTVNKLVTALNLVALGYLAHFLSAHRKAAAAFAAAAAVGDAARNMSR